MAGDENEIILALGKRVATNPSMLAVGEYVNTEGKSVSVVEIFLFVREHGGLKKIVAGPTGEMTIKSRDGRAITVHPINLLADVV